MMTSCCVCKKKIWPWQKAVHSGGKTYSAHEKCKPEGFTGEWKREWEVK